MSDYGCRTPFAGSLALQSMSYRAMGYRGMDEDSPLETIPESLRKKPSQAMKLLGREITRETRRLDMREMKRAFNGRDDQ